VESPRALVVDDDPAVLNSLRRALTAEGYSVETASDGLRAIEAARSNPDVMILDVLMPGMDGLEACRAIRGAGNTLPILMLTARDGVSDRVEGLDAGADDYLVKPFALEELTARLRALLRRTVSSDSSSRLQFADLTLDQETYEVTRAGRPLSLTRTEFLLLELFLLNPKRVLSRSLIFERIWGYDFGPTSNSLDVYIGYLRKKTEAGGEPRLIHTIRGVGYVLKQS
jgi:two-component system response regulator MprA